MWMRRQQTVTVCFCLISVTVRVLGNECDTEIVTDCYENVVHFEGAAFPYYGANEEQLDHTCKAINATFECIEDFINLCDGNPICDEDCKNNVSLMTSVIQTSGLPALYDELCVPGKLLRQTYLDSYDCLENGEEKYQRCYNLSQQSKIHMKTIEDPDEESYATCCFYSWYQHCYTDATMNQCTMNATFYVSYSMHILVGQVAEKMCGKEIKCTEPPLPDDGSRSVEVSTKDTADITDNSIEEKHQQGGTGLVQMSSVNLIIGLLLVVFAILYD